MSLASSSHEDITGDIEMAQCPFVLTTDSNKETIALTINIYHILLETSLDPFTLRMHVNSIFTTIALLAMGASAIPLDTTMSNRR